MGRQELDELNLDMVAGGANMVKPAPINQNTTGNKNAVNQNNVNGKNQIGVVQYNHVKGNNGNVKIGSPVNIDHPAGPININ